MSTPSQSNSKSHSAGMNLNRETAHPGRRKSFDLVEQQAREVLRERGYSDEQIQSELKRIRREDPL